MSETLEPRRLLDGDPNDQIGEAIPLGALAPSAAVSGSIESPTDVNMYSFSVQAGDEVEFDIDTQANGAPGLGSYIRIFDQAGTELAFNNDAQAPDETQPDPDESHQNRFFDAYLRYTFQADGIYSIGVSSWRNTTYNPVSGEDDVAGLSYSTGDYDLTVTSRRTESGAPDVRVRDAKLDTSRSAATFRYEAAGVSGSFEIGLFLSSDAVHDPTDERIDVKSVKPPVGSSAEDSLSSASLGNRNLPRYLLVVADPTNALHEVDRTNNVAALELPDLAIESLMVVGAGGDRRAVVGYSLSGGPLTSPALLRLYWATGPEPSDRLAGAVAAERMTVTRPDGSTSVEIPVSELVGPPVQARYLQVVADPDGRLSEMDESNNIATLSRIDPAGANDPLGSLSGRYETGGRGLAAISSVRSEPGGKAYGPYQFTSLPRGGTVGMFVAQYYAGVFTKEIRRGRTTVVVPLIPGSQEFDARWRRLSAEQPSAMLAHIRGFVTDRQYLPGLAAVQASTGLSLDRRGHTLRDVIWSTAIQHGPAGSGAVFRNALAPLLSGRTIDQVSDGEIIRAVYQERGRRRPDGRFVYFPSAAKTLWAGLASRFRDEGAAALARLDAESRF